MEEVTTRPVTKNSTKSNITKFPSTGTNNKGAIDVFTHLVGALTDAAGLVELTKIPTAELHVLIDDAWDLLDNQSVTWLRKNGKHTLKALEVTGIQDYNLAVLVYHTLVYLIHIFNMEDVDDCEALMTLENHIADNFHEAVVRSSSIDWRILGDYSLSDHACTRLLAMPLVIASMISEARREEFLLTAEGDPYHYLDDGIMH